MTSIKIVLNSGVKNRHVSTNMKIYSKMSCVMRKLASGLCENKDTDQLCSDREADQPLFYATLMVQSLYFL